MLIYCAMYMYCAENSQQVLRLEVRKVCIRHAGCVVHICPYNNCINIAQKYKHAYL